MHPKTLDAIKAQALAEYPWECGGFVVAVGRKELYVPCKSQANPLKAHTTYIASAEDYAMAEDMGNIVAFVHSHPDHTAEPSEADRTACEASNLTWVIVSVGMSTEGNPEIHEIRSFSPEGFQAPLIGREFAHGVNDCYALIRDFHSRMLGIELPEHEREDEWWNDGHSNLYLDNYEKDGWVALEKDAQLKVGDMVLMQIRSKNGVPNHAGVISRFDHLGQPQMLHHLYDSRSLESPYVDGSPYMEATTLIVRRKELL